MVTRGYIQIGVRNYFLDSESLHFREQVTVCRTLTIMVLNLDSEAPGSKRYHGTTRPPFPLCRPPSQSGIVCVAPPVSLVSPLPVVSVGCGTR